jgi:hypothetical protein
MEGKMFFEVISPIEDLKYVKTIKYLGKDSFGEYDEAPYKFRYLASDNISLEIIYLSLQDIYKALGEKQFQLFEVIERGNNGRTVGKTQRIL